MPRKYLATMLLFLIGMPAISDNGLMEEDNSWLNRISEFRQELESIRENAEVIHQSLDLFNLEIVIEEFLYFQESLDRVESGLEKLNGSEKAETRNTFLSTYEEMLESYNDLMNLYDFYVQLQDKKEEWSNTYFSLWEQTYALKTRIDKMYVKEEKMNVHYGGMDNYEYQSVRKRNLYEACTGIYNTALLDLKSTGDCDHYERILILEELIPVLRKCEKLSYSEDTRDLEKELKREENVQVMEEMILNFQE